MAARGHLAGNPPGRFQRATAEAGKRSRTRALLLDTAIRVFAQKGIERGSVVEIAHEAGLSNASFYYHFRDKSELVAAVGRAIAAAVVEEIDVALDPLADGAERVACGTRLMIRKALAEPDWGRLIERALADMGEFAQEISRGIRKDVAIGIAQGRFDVEPSDALFTMLLGLVGAAIRARLDDPSAPPTEAMGAAAVLRVLGVPAGETGAIVERAMVRLEPDAEARP